MTFLTYVFVALILILMLVSLALKFADHFSVVYVKGKSMQPTYKDGTVMLAKHSGMDRRELKEGDVVFVHSPSGELVLKRIAKVTRVDDPTAYVPEVWMEENPSAKIYWILGDNRGEDSQGRRYSMDSRYYGYLHEDAVFAYAYPQRQPLIDFEEENEEEEFGKY